MAKMSGASAKNVLKPPKKTGVPITSNVRLTRSERNHKLNLFIYNRFYQVNKIKSIKTRYMDPVYKQSQAKYN